MRKHKLYCSGCMDLVEVPKYFVDGDRTPLLPYIFVKTEKAAKKILKEQFELPVTRVGTLEVKLSHRGDFGTELYKDHTLGIFKCWTV